MRYHLEQSIHIDVPLAEAHASLVDYRQWPKWSPWLYMENGVQLDYSGDAGEVGHGYTWKGDVTGSGSMTLELIEDTSLGMDLLFITPFKSKAKVRFDLTVDGDATKVTWHMDGNMPFFLFWMIPSIKVMVGQDYARGLKLLKEHLEDGVVRSKAEVEGVVDVAEKAYVAQRDEVAIADLGASMSKTIPAAYAAANQGGFTAAGPVMSVVHDFNMKTGRCAYSAAVPVSGDGSAQAPIETGRIATCRALKVVHTGAYDHLSNAWATAKAHQRSLKLKDSKVQPPFEIYVSDPKETPPEELITEIYLPVR